AMVSGGTGPYRVQARTAYEPRAYARVLSADGRAGDQLAAEAAQATALRVRRALSDSAVSGFAVTALDPFGFADRHAFAAAADTAVFDAGRDWTAAVQVGGALLAGGTDSVLLDGTVLGAGARGW